MTIEEKLVALVGISVATLALPQFPMLAQWAQQNPAFALALGVLVLLWLFSDLRQLTIRFCTVCCPGISPANRQSHQPVGFRYETHIASAFCR